MGWFKSALAWKFVNLSLRLLVFALILVVESRRSTFNITRYTEGDLFQNINSSRSCNESGAREDDPVLVERNISQVSFLFLEMNVECIKL